MLGCGDISPPLCVIQFPVTSLLLDVKWVECTSVPLLFPASLPHSGGKLPISTSGVAAIGMILSKTAFAGQKGRGKHSLKTTTPTCRCGALQTSASQQKVAFLCHCLENSLIVGRGVRVGSLRCLVSGGRDTTKHVTVHRTAPHNELSGPKCQ